VRARFFKGWPRLAAALGVSAALAIACSGPHDLPPHLTGGGSGGSAGGTAPDSGGPCTNGQTRDCSVTLGEHNGVLTCYDGTRTCVGGSWGACGDGTVNNRAGTSGGNGRSSQSLSSPTLCQNNPCDPSCRSFNEQPDAGITSDAATPKFTWSGGTLSGLPTGLANKGLKQPCSDGSDCQFNSYCQHPITSSVCTHSKCQTGAGLDATCDSTNSCIQNICSANPSCCDQPRTTSCSHDPCDKGSALGSGCDTCAQKVCSYDSSCCNNKWDNFCVSEADTYCGCPLTTPGDWNQSCVDAVNTVCDARCGTGSPSPDDGTCVPWLPGQTDSSCSGIDLSVGVACDSSGVGTIPVCNHGTQTANAGITIVTFAANSNQYPQCAPDLSKAKATCTTNAPIPPGQCINVTGCLPLNNMEIMVNPAGSTHKPECSCQDNWSLYKGGTTCGPPSCSGVKSEATFKPVNIYFTVDKSGSMFGAKWDGTTSALQSFFTSNTPNIGAALEFFPLWSSGTYGDGCGDPTCSTIPCSNPMVGLSTLPSNALANALAQVWPGGSTPTYPALDGALSWAETNQAANPNAIYVVVLVTDGEPTVCDINNNDIAALADNAYINNGIRTYTIAMAGANVSALDQIAKAGGTGKAFVISGTTNVSQQLTTALQSIAGQNASCSFDLPNQGAFDPNDATVSYTSGSGTSTTLPKAQNAGSCGAGWYYDNNTNPISVTLCPQTCTQVQSDPGAKVSVQLGCPKAYGPVTYTQTYQATCPSGTMPQWGYLAYDTTTPVSSNVSFRVRTASTQAGLSSAPYVGAATAQASPDTQLCPLSGPSPCPVDLYPKLGQYDANNPYLELSVTLNPTSDQSQSPTVNNWQLTYSCPPAQ
jgi:hypothetical protein